MPLILKQHAFAEPNLMYSKELWTSMKETCFVKEGLQLHAMIEKVTKGQRRAITTAIVEKDGRPEIVNIISLPEFSYFMMAGLAVKLSTTPSSANSKTLEAILPSGEENGQQFWYMPDGIAVLPDDPFWLESQMHKADKGENAHIGGLICRPCSGTSHERITHETQIDDTRALIERVFQNENHPDSQILLT